MRSFRVRWRPWVIVTVGVLLLGLVLHTAAAVVAGRRLAETVDRLQARWGPLGYEAMAPPRVERHENRARAIRAAMDMLVLDPMDQPTLVRFVLEQGEKTPEEVARVDAILDRNELALEILEEASRRTRSNWEIRYARGVDAQLPELIPVRQLDSLNCAAALRDAQRGFDDQAAARLSAGLAMTESLAGEPMLFFELVRIAVQQSTLVCLHRLLETGNPSATALSSLLPRIRAFPNERGLLGEMKLVNHQWEIEDGRSHGGLARTPRVLRLLWRPLLRADIRFLLEEINLLAEYTSTPFHARSSAFDRAPGDVEPPDYYNISRVSLPSLRRFTPQCDATDALVALGRTAVQLRIHRLERGAYPDSLEALGQIEQDPFSGEPLLYERVGEGFALESAGVDLAESDGSRLAWSSGR